MRVIVALATRSTDSIRSRGTSQLSRFPASAGSIFCIAAIRLAHFVDFGARGCGKREQAFAQALAGSL